MPRYRWWLSPGAVVLGILGSAGGARAQEPPAVVVGVSPTASPLDRDDPRAARLQATLDYYAQADRDRRRATGWSLIGAGAAAVGAGAYVGVQSKDATWFLASALGATLAADGLIALLVPSYLEDLAAYGRLGGRSPSVEALWVNASRQERSRRHWAGILGIVAGGLTLGFGVFTLLDTQWFGSNSTGRNALGSVLVAFGAFDGIVAAYNLSTDGPIESALHAYERSSGRTLWPERGALGHVHIAPVPGGVMSSLSVTF